MSVPTPDEVVLGLLAAEPQHGYQLLEVFQDPQALGRVWKMSTSQLYKVLRRLETLGLIAGWVEHLPDVPPRTVYRVTAAGRQRVEDWLNAPPGVSVRSVRVEYMSRRYVAARLRLPLSPLTQRQRAALQAHRDAIAVILSATPIETAALSLEQTLLDALLSWLDQLPES